MKCAKRRKYALKWKRYLISVCLEIFSLYEHVLATYLEKYKTNFPRLCFGAYVRCNYGILRNNDLLSKLLKIFAQSPWNLVDMVFTSVHVKRKIRTRLFRMQTEAMPQSYWLVITYFQIGSGKKLWDLFRTLPWNYTYYNFENQVYPPSITRAKLKIFSKIIHKFLKIFLHFGLMQGRPLLL